LNQIGRGAPYLALAGGVLAFSTSGVLTKLCDADAIAIAFWVRLFSLSYLLGAMAMYRVERRADRLRHALLLGLPGGCLFAIHLLFFFAALKQTSVTVVFLLSALNPALVAVAGALLLNERLTWRQAAWTAVAIVAATCVVLMRDSSGRSQMTGNALAVAATIGYCAYFIVSRRARQSVTTIDYMVVVTATSSIVLGLIAVVAGVPFAPGGSRDVLILALMGLIPATAGHFLVNWSLRHVPAHRASVVLLAVPLFASLWAYLLVGERVSVGQIATGVAVLVAIPGAVRTGGTARIAPAR
jgi:drug/metabolite transporter (DMT)-like permease